MKNKKVLWISDFNLSHTIGGAQRSNDLIIKKGKELGLSIFEANFNFNFKICDFNDYDIVISSNLEAISQAYPDIIDKIAQHKFHVRLEHDLNRYLKENQRIKLFQSCKKTFFLTDFHYQLFKVNYGDIFKNIEIVADPIDTNLFFDKKQNREDKILYVGFMHEMKGTTTFFEYVFSKPETEFVIAGWGSNMYTFLAQNAPNVKFLGPVEYENMPDLYNQYETIFYSPILPEPFCRSICEAALCGTRIMSFSPKNIGCLNEMDRLGKDILKNNCENAPEIFWEKICN